MSDQQTSEMEMMLHHMLPKMMHDNETLRKTNQDLVAEQKRSLQEKMLMITDLANERLEYKKVLETLQNRLEKLDMECTSERISNQELRTMNDTLRKENDILRMENDTLKSRVDKLESKVDKLEIRSKQLTLREAMRHLEWYICLESNNNSKTATMSGKFTITKLIEKKIPLPQWLEEKHVNVLQYFKDAGDYVLHDGSSYSIADLSEALKDEDEDDDAAIQIKDDLCKHLQLYCETHNIAFGTNPRKKTSSKPP